MKFLFVLSSLLVLSQVNAQTADKTANIGSQYPVEKKTSSHKSGNSISGTKEKPFDAVEDMPRFPGGDKAMYDWLYKNLNYPDTAQQRGIEGKVYVRFVISENGKVECPEVVRGIDPACDKEAQRVVSTLPDWIPGRKNGRNVPVYYLIAIVFRMPR